MVKELGTELARVREESFDLEHSIWLVVCMVTLSEFHTEPRKSFDSHYRNEFVVTCNRGARTGVSGNGGAKAERRPATYSKLGSVESYSSCTVVLASCQTSLIFQL